MILSKIDPETPTLIGDVKPQQEFLVEEKNLGHLLELCYKHAYSDPIGSMQREYITNGLDSQKEQGTTRPLEVHLPTELESYWGCRDFGTGLSPEAFHATFCSHGSSTKNRSNDYTGMFGIGAKSAAAYTSRFSVTSFFEGKKYTYDIYISDGEKGEFRLIAEEETQEPNGLEIKIPIAYKDICSVRIKFAHLTPFLPRKQVVLSPTSNTCEWGEYPVLWESQGCRLVTSTQSLLNKNFLVMGNIAYPINTSDLGGKTNKYLQLLTKAFGYKIHIHANIGDVEPNAGREQLRYSRKTKAYIFKRLRQLYFELKKHLTHSQFDASSEYEAVKELRKRKKNDHELTKCNVPIASEYNIWYKGKKVTHDYLVYKSTQEGNSVVKTSRRYMLVPSDCDKGYGKRKINSWLNRFDLVSYIKVESYEHFYKWAKEVGFPLELTINFDDYKIPSAPRKPSLKFNGLYILNESNKFSVSYSRSRGYATKVSSIWRKLTDSELQAIDGKSVRFVRTNRLLPFGAFSISQFAERVKVAEKVGLDTTIYSAPSKTIDRLIKKGELNPANEVLSLQDLFDFKSVVGKYEKYAAIERYEDAWKAGWSELNDPEIDSIFKNQDHTLSEVARQVCEFAGKKPQIEFLNSLAKKIDAFTFFSYNLAHNKYSIQYREEGKRVFKEQTEKALKEIRK